MCSNPQMDDDTDERLRAALESLCKGGAKRRHQVAQTLGVNDQTLYQIIRRMTMPSGKVRSIGPDLRQKLDEHFPGWSGLANVTSLPPPTFDAALPIVLRRLAGLNSSAFAAVLGALEQVRGHPEAVDDAESFIKAVTNAKQLRTGTA
jgi:hypothetical protein